MISMQNIPYGIIETCFLKILVRKYFCTISSMGLLDTSRGELFLWSDQKIQNPRDRKWEIVKLGKINERGILEEKRDGQLIGLRKLPLKMIFNLKNCTRNILAELLKFNFTSSLKEIFLLNYKYGMAERVLRS